MEGRGRARLWEEVVALVLGLDCIYILWMTLCSIVCAGVVSTLAGSGTADWADGLGTAASFNSPRDVSMDSNGAVYVADSGIHRIRMISSSGVCMDAALHKTLSSSVSVGCPIWMRMGEGGGLSVLDCGWMLWHW